MKKPMDYLIAAAEAAAGAPEKEPKPTAWKNNKQEQLAENEGMIIAHVIYSKHTKPVHCEMEITFKLVYLAITCNKCMKNLGKLLTVG